MKNKSERIIILRIMAIYSAIMLGLLAILWFVTSEKSSTPHAEETANTPVEKEYIYLNADTSNTESNDSSLENSLDEIYTVKEYLEKIGIFDSEGRLLQILEVYIKTLPEADKRLLREGFEVSGKKQLNSIIEDYTE